MPTRPKPRLVRVAGRDDWHIYWHDEQGRHRVTTGTPDRAQAERDLATFVADQGRPVARLGITGILDAYLADRRDAAIPGAERLAWAHKPLRGFWGDRPPETITDPELRRYRRERPVAPSTLRTEIQALSAALRWAAARKLIPEVPHVPLPPRSPPRERWLTRDEAAQLLAACQRPHIRLFVQLALRTAARAGAILALTWDRVDLERRRIDYREPGRPETRKRRVPVPINDTLLAELIPAHQARTCEWVVEWAGKRVGSVKHGLHETATRAGVSDVTPHVLRHTAATWMAQEGVPLWEIAGFLGHSDAAMVAQVYGHHSPDNLARAAKALG